MPFHDCGTFNVNRKTGGCNGSLRKELPETMPLQDVTTVSPHGWLLLIISSHDDSASSSLSQCLWRDIKTVAAHAERCNL
jgi:hypothetical protein